MASEEASRGWSWLWGAALAVVAGGLTVYLAWQSGGYFPGATAMAAVVLLVTLVLRVLLAPDAFAGFSWPLAIGAGALTLLAVWTLASSAWSDSAARAMTEFDRTFLYLLALVLFGSVPRTSNTVRWLVWGLAAAMVAISVAAFITRVFPDFWSAPPELQRNRLSYPIGYWNALGLVAAMAMVLCLHLTCSFREPLPLRIAGAAAIPVCASTLLFTFSRGPLAVVIVGLLAYLVLGRPRLWPTGLVAAVPPAAVAVAVTYGADFSAEFVKGRGYEALSAAGLDEAHSVGITVLLCAAGAAAFRALGGLVLDPALGRLKLGRRTRKRLALGAAGLATVVVVGAVVAGLSSGWIDRQYDRLVSDPVTQTGDYRDRLLNPGLNRTDRWDAAWESFKADPVAGTGAGTYRLTWERTRRTDSDTNEAHSLYLETLGELGIVGGILLAAALLAIFGAMAARLRGRDRTVYAALLAAALVWALHAALDWDWELPAVTLWVFAAGGLAMAAPAGKAGTPLRLGIPVRAVIAVGLALLAITPVRLALSSQRLSDAAVDYRENRCSEAIESARSSLSALGNRPEPYQVEAYCLARAGQPAQAVEAMKLAVSRDPENWHYRYGLALTQGLAGLDPRVAARQANRLNPYERDTQRAVRALRGKSPARWRRAARRLGFGLAEQRQ